MSGIRRFAIAVLISLLAYPFIIHDAMGQETGSSSGKKLVEDLFAIWNTKDVAKIDSIFTEEAVYEDVPDQSKLVGRDSIKAFMKEIFTWSPDMEVELTSIYVSDDWAAIEWTWGGTQTGDIPGLIKATNRSYSLIGASIIEFDEGKIKRNSDYYDAARLLSQLGVEFTFPSDQPDN